MDRARDIWMRFVVAVAVAQAACSEAGTAVVLSVEAPGLAVERLEVAARFQGRMLTRSVTVPAGAAFPTSVVAAMPDEALEVVFDVTGYAGGAAVGRGSSAPVQVRPHEVATATVVLRADEAAAGPWSARRGGLAGTITGLFGTASGDVYATCTLEGGVNLLRTRDRGQTWTAMRAGDASLNGGWADGVTIYLAGDAGTLLAGDGTTFAQEATGLATPVALRAVWGAGGGNVYAVGERGTVLHRILGSWLSEGPTQTDSWNAVWGPSADEVLVVGARGALLRAVAGGGLFPQASLTDVDLRGLWGAAGEVYAVGDAGVILRRRAGGDWVREDGGVTTALFAVWAAGAEDVYAVGRGFTILHRAGGAWRREASGLEAGHPLADGFRAVFGTGADDVYAGGAGQAIVHRP